MPRIKIIFLGTNGWYDTATGNTICTLIDAPQAYVVLDAGNGIYKLDKYIKEPKPIYIFLSHLHLDHIEGLHTLAKFNFPQGITICIPKGLRKLFFSLLNKNFTAPLSALATRCRVIEINPKKGGPAFLQKALPLRHPVPCLGFRFNFGGKIITYIADTGLCPNAFLLAREADLVLSECAMPAGKNSDAWPHLDPESAAEIAKNSRAGQLILTHFDAAEYPSLKKRLLAEKLAKKIYPSTLVAQDNLRIFI